MHGWDAFFFLFHHYSNSFSAPLYTAPSHFATASSAQFNILSSSFCTRFPLHLSYHFVLCFARLCASALNSLHHGWDLLWMDEAVAHIQDHSSYLLAWRLELAEHSTLRATSEAASARTAWQNKQGITNDSIQYRYRIGRALLCGVGLRSRTAWR